MARPIWCGIRSTNNLIVGLRKINWWRYSNRWFRIPILSGSLLTDMDWCLYKYRHLIENLFARLKHFRSIATRYDKLKRNYASMLTLACGYLWLPMWPIDSPVIKSLNCTIDSGHWRWGDFWRRAIQGCKGARRQDVCSPKIPPPPVLTTLLNHRT